MPSKLILALCFLGILFGSACARKGTPSGKLRLNLGAATSGLPLKGAYIWGHNKSFGLTFGAHIPGDGRDIELPLRPGIWNFKVVTWEGPGGMFEGTTRCGVSPDIAFQGGDQDVPIHVGQDCSHPFFTGGGTNFIDTTSGYNQMKPLALHTCRSLADISTGTSTCEYANKGETISFYIVLPSYLPRPEGEFGPYAPQSLRSACISTLVPGPTGTPFQIPVGNGSPESARVVIEAFDGPSCTGNMIPIQYRFGLLGIDPNYGKIFHNSSAAILYIKHGLARGTGLATQEFGDGADGTINLTSGGPINFGIDSYTNAQPNTRVWSARRRVESFNGNLMKLTSTFSTGFSGEFRVGDEVMWHVSISNTNDACNINDGSPNHLFAGKFGFARIIDANGTPGIRTLTLDRPLPTVDNPNLNNDLLFLNPASTKHCVIQAIRVPNLKNLNLSVSPPTFVTDPFVMGQVGLPSTGQGGIIVLRIQNRLTLGTNLIVNLNGSGFPSYDDNPGTDVSPAFQGVGGFGFTQTNCSPSCDAPMGPGGGVGLVASAGGGGGAHWGEGGNGGYDNSGPTGIPGLGGIAIKTLLPLLGASGGHGKSDTNIMPSTTGGRGGGIIMISAREIVGAGSLILSTNGASGFTSALGNGGGGGAGGTNIVVTQYLGSNLTMISTGGGGANATATQCPGGGGGGGVNYLRACMWDDLKSRIFNTNFGPAGTAVSCPMPSSYGAAGLSSVPGPSMSEEFCPGPI